MIPAAYDFKIQYGGDTTRPVPFAFSIDLTGVQAAFTISLNSQEVFSATLGNGLSLAGDTLTLEPFEVPNPDLRTDNYSYDLRLTFPDGAVRTYLVGAFPVMKNRA